MINQEAADSRPAPGADRPSTVPEAPASPATSPSAEPSNQRRQHILDAALDVIAERGFKGASIKRIADRAGLKSPALIYWYFKDKDHLLETLLHEQAPLLGQVEAGDALLDQAPERVLGMLADAFVH